MDKVVIASFYPAYPFVHGGQRRIFFLSRELARDHEVTLVTLSRGRELKHLEFGRGFIEIRVPAGQRYVDLEQRLMRDSKMPPEAIYALHWKQCRLYQSVLREQIRAMRLAISEHPYPLYAIQHAKGRARAIPILYNAHNVEVIRSRSIPTSYEKLVPLVRSIEQAAVAESAAIAACSDVDRDAFGAEYSAPTDKITVIGNGVDCGAVPKVSADRRWEFRRRLGLGDRFTAIFGASLYFPNVAAVECLLAAAARLPDIAFIILGTVCNSPVLQGALPSNVLTLGPLPEADKWLAYIVSDVALNPMSLGSGSNVKMFEYAAAGLPALSTEFGARGTAMRPGVHYYPAALDEFAARLAELTRLDRGELAGVGSAARALVQETSDWRVIGKRYRALVSELLSDGRRV